MDPRQQQRLQAAALEETRRHDALRILGVRRREALTKLDYNAYLDGLTDIAADVVEDACEQLGREEPGEYETRFPMLATLRKRCDRVIRERAERAYTERLRLVAKPMQSMKRASPEKLAELKQRIQAAIADKRMP